MGWRAAGVGSVCAPATAATPKWEGRWCVGSTAAVWSARWTGQGAPPQPPRRSAGPATRDRAEPSHRRLPPSTATPTRLQYHCFTCRGGGERPHSMNPLGPPHRHRATAHTCGSTRQPATPACSPPWHHHATPVTAVTQSSDDRPAQPRCRCRIAAAVARAKRPAPTRPRQLCPRPRSPDPVPPAPPQAPRWR